MRLLILCGVALVACDVNRPAVDQPSRHGEALLATGLIPVAPTGPPGPAEEDQRDPDVATGPGGERLVVWVDQRNFRFRRSDIYGARVLDGGVLHPLGLPIASGQLHELDPSIAFERRGSRSAPRRTWRSSPGPASTHPMPAYPPGTSRA